MGRLSSQLSQITRGYSAHGCRQVGKWLMALLGKSWWKLVETLCSPTGSRLAAEQIAENIPSKLEPDWADIGNTQTSIKIYKDIHISLLIFHLHLLFLHVFWDMELLWQISNCESWNLLGWPQVRKAADSEFGQALAVASLVRPKGARERRVAQPCQEGPGHPVGGGFSCYTIPGES